MNDLGTNMTGDPIKFGCPPHVSRLLRATMDYDKIGNLMCQTYEYKCVVCGHRWSETPLGYDCIRLDGNTREEQT